MTGYLQQRTLFPPQIQSKPSLNLGLVVVIPAHDEPFLLLSLMSLKKCDLPECDVEVIIIVNESEKASEAIKERNRQMAEQAAAWTQKNNRPRLKFSVLHHSLPAKHAGVGLARKIGMDEACWRLERARNPQGVIACFDADSRCTPNYFQAIEKHFKENPDAPACSIYFEHPLAGADFDEPVYQAIAEYELHLRYYIQAQRYAGFPHAFHTVGSSMAVRGSAYQQQGGMNKRKAGEDFYFIHKFTLLPGFGVLNTTRVIPSPRPSHRVPFGTGRAIQEITRQKGDYQTYAFENFEELRAFLRLLPDLYRKNTEILDSLHAPLLHVFLETQDFTQKLEEIKHHSSSYVTFQNRFFRWFNAFLVMKYLHFARDRGRADVPVTLAASALLNKLDVVYESLEDKDLLTHYRNLDRS
jgi:hypothetical protein